MFLKERGFTLIELLIVVAIIGILAALLIPNGISAIQKAKQKGTMKDINVIAAAIMHYITDKGVAPSSNNGPMTETADALSSALVPFYLKAIPAMDQWGGPYMDTCMYLQTSGQGGYCHTGFSRFK